MTIMHRKYLALEQYHYNNSGSDCWVSSHSHCYCSSLCTSCAPALIVIIYNLFRRKKKGHEWPRLMIISVSKAENKKKIVQICCLYRLQWVERATACSLDQISSTHKCSETNYFQGFNFHKFHNSTILYGIIYNFCGFCFHKFQKIACENRESYWPRNFSAICFSYVLHIV